MFPAPPTPSFSTSCAHSGRPIVPISAARALVDRHPLSVDYLEHNRRVLRLHLEPFPGFQGLRLSKLRAGIVKDWQLWRSSMVRGRVFAIWPSKLYGSPFVMPWPAATFPPIL
jgi:hypothetical protein